MTGSIPDTIDDVTTEWVAGALGSRVDSMSAEQIGVGIGVSSAVYRLTLQGDGPASIILKLPALDEAAVFTSSMLRMYIREVRFFAELAADCPIRVPQSYYGEVDEETSRFVQLMEDMGSLRVIDQNEGMTIADAERAVDALAGWHAHWWGAADPIVERGTAMALSDPIYGAVLPMVFAEGWEKVNAEMTVDPAVLAVGPGWIDALPRLLTALDTAPTTITHGDYRADNMLFTDDNELVLLDFQLTGRATASYDLAYLITQSLGIADAEANEAALFERWVAALIAHGVSEAETSQLWESYRVAALFCLVYPIVASRGMDLTDERQYQLIDNMNGRFGRVVDQLNLVDLL